MYKYELHCHTGRISLCGKVEPKKIVDLYKEKGYNGIVLTDHYSPMTFWKNHLLAPQKAMDFWLSAYHEMKEYAGEDFTILLGMELRHWFTVNDYLIYGTDEEIVRSLGNMLIVGEKKVYQIFHEKGCLVYQAHPFRPFIRRASPDVIDGIEIHNGHTSAPKNAQAKLWAEQLGKGVSSGSDFHELRDVARGGIITEEPIKTNEDLLRVLRSGAFRIIETD